MPKKRESQSTEKGQLVTTDQVSVGGVAFRWVNSNVQIAIVSVKPSFVTILASEGCFHAIIFSSNFNLMPYKILNGLGFIQTVQWGERERWARGGVGLLLSPLDTHCRQHPKPDL